MVIIDAHLLNTVYGNLYLYRNKFVQKFGFFYFMFFDSLSDFIEIKG